MFIGAAVYPPLLENTVSQNPYRRQNLKKTHGLACNPPPQKAAASNGRAAKRKASRAAGSVGFNIGGFILVLLFRCLISLLDFLYKVDTVQRL